MAKRDFDLDAELVVLDASGGWSRIAWEWTI